MESPNIWSQRSIMSETGVLHQVDKNRYDSVKGEPKERETNYSIQDCSYFAYSSDFSDVTNSKLSLIFS